MGNAVRIAISLPSEMLEAVERERRSRRETGSEFHRLVVEAFLRRERRQENVERYVHAYRQQPETEDEIEAADSAASEIVAQEPWE